MAIFFNETTGLITLQTADTTYQMKIDDLGTLVHTYYGSHIDETSDMSTQINHQLRGFSSNPFEKGYTERTYTLDTLPQEYSCFGTGDYRITALHVENDDGSRASQLRATAVDVLPGKYGIEGLPAVYADEDEAETLRVTLKDQATAVTVELYYGVLEQSNIITRSARIINGSKAEIALAKAASMNLDLPFGTYDWMTYWGRHAQERTLSRQAVHHGVQAIGSVRGISSHHYNPFSILCAPTTTETTGRCFGFALMYSGEFSMEVEKDQADQTRFICGIHPDNFRWILEPGASFSTPEVILAFSDSGFETLSHRLHDVMRDHVCRGTWKHKRRPILINNWEATYFKFTGEKLISIAKKAQSLGIEMFVMDDGWFGERNDDDRALGDWFPNEEKLGMPLKELAESINELGMRFGIWFEPESISENSDLYREHPDWAITIPGRRPAIDRRQLILDYTRADVRAYIIERMSDILGNNPISYVKWDINRSISDKFSHNLDSHHQGEFSHRFVLGLYEVLETLTSRFPEVLFEGCAGGGGRFDAGMLYYTPQIWCSDNTDAYDRLNIQYGTSFAYPISAVGAHVSAVPNHQSGRTTRLKTRGVVAMAGTFGYELDITKLTDEETEEVKDQVKTFSRFYDVIQYGDYYRLETGKPYCNAWEMASKDGSEALVSVVYHEIPVGYAPVHVSIRGLKPASLYEIEVLDTQREQSLLGIALGQIPAIQSGTKLSGAALQNGGLTLPPAVGDGQAWQISIREIATVDAAAQGDEEDSVIFRLL